MLENVIRTKIQMDDKPITTPDIIGAQNEILGNDVHLMKYRNQKFPYGLSIA